MCSASMMSVRQRDAMFVHACQDMRLALAEASVDLYHVRIYLFRALYDEENHFSPVPIPAWPELAQLVSVVFRDLNLALGHSELLELVSFVYPKPRFSSHPRGNLYTFLFASVLQGSGLLNGKSYCI